MRRSAMVLVAAVAVTSVWAGSATADRGATGGRAGTPDAGGAGARRRDHAPDQLRRPRGGVVPVHGCSRRHRHLPERPRPTRGVHEPRALLSVRRPRVVAGLTPDARRGRRRGVGELRGRRDRTLRILLLVDADDPRRRALVLHRGGVVRVAERRHVDRHQHADGQGREDPAVRVAEPRERPPAPGDDTRGDVPVRGFVPPALAGVRVLRGRLHRRDPRRRRLHGLGARRSRATAIRRRTTSPRARRSPDDS